MHRYSADGVGGKVLPMWRGPRPVWLTDRFLNVLAVLDHGEEIIRLDWKNPPRMLHGVNYAFRRSVFERLGGFNTILGSRGEDQELFDRLRRSRACVIYDPAIIVHHELVTDRLTKTYYRDWYRATGRARAKLDHGPARSILGIPLFMMRKGVETLGRFAMAVVRRDREAAFAEYLTLNYWATFYGARARGHFSGDFLAPRERAQESLH
jgi:GT2 family glycosyltransferase